MKVINLWNKVFNIWIQVCAEHFLCSNFVKFENPEKEKKVIILFPTGRDETEFFIGFTEEPRRNAQIFYSKRTVEDGSFVVIIPSTYSHGYFFIVNTNYLGLGLKSKGPPQLGLDSLACYKKGGTARIARHLDVYQCPRQC